MRRLLVLLFSLGSYFGMAQKYILFERHKGFSEQTLVEGLKLSQNEIRLESGDTSLNIFNLYYSSDHTFNWEKYSTVFASNKNYALMREVIITLTPIVLPGSVLELELLDEEEFKKINVVSNKELFESAVKDLFTHLTERYHSMPELSNTRFGLLIKDGQKIYRVKQQVLLTKYAVGGNFTYYPEQFQSGILHIENVRNVKTYQLEDFKKFEEATRLESRATKDVIARRTYLGEIMHSTGFFTPVYWFWEFKRVMNDPFDPVGLESFYFLRDVGVINCTMHYYLKDDFKLNERPAYKIVGINGLTTDQFQKAFNNYQEKIKPKRIVVIENNN